MQKQKELEDPTSCMNRALEDEVTFVLLARDKAAPATIRFWIGERIRLRKNKPGDAQLKEADDCAIQMGVQRLTRNDFACFRANDKEDEEAAELAAKLRAFAVRRGYGSAEADAYVEQVLALK